MKRAKRIGLRPRTTVTQHVSASSLPPAETLWQVACNLWDRKRFKQAFQFMSEAAEAGCDSAQVDLGYFYDVGIGVAKNPKLAKFWYRRSAAAGNAAGAYNLGILYRDLQRKTTARAWFNRAIELGDEDGHIELARMHMSSRRVNHRAAKQHLRTVLRSKKSHPDSKRTAAALLAEIE